MHSNGTLLLTLTLDHQMLCILKHVGGVEGQNNLRHLRHALTWITVDGVVEKSHLFKTHLRHALT